MCRELRSVVAAGRGSQPRRRSSQVPVCPSKASRSQRKSRRGYVGRGRWPAELRRRSTACLHVTHPGLRSAASEPLRDRPGAVMQSNQSDCRAMVRLPLSALSDLAIPGGIRPSSIRVCGTSHILESESAVPRGSFIACPERMVVKVESSWSLEMVHPRHLCFAFRGNLPWESGIQTSIRCGARAVRVLLGGVPA